MKTALIARGESGNVLYDTSKSIYGLIKSGPVTYHGRWMRLRPSGGGYPSYQDSIYKFEVEGGVSPILFVYGDCGKPYQSKEGTKQVFYFAGPIGELKIYCFDIMRPIFSGPALKTRAEDGRFTFNSLQWPLNVIGASTPPPPEGVGGDSIRPFAGGRSGILQYPTMGSGIAGSMYARVKINLNASKKYAAHIPWSRGVEWVYPFETGGGHVDNFRGSGEEGCSGTDGGVNHLIWTAPETTFGSVHTTTPVRFFNMAWDRLPRCPYIDIAEYPYPFDPQL